MASSYSSRLRLELIATGEQSGTWGTTTNTNLGTLIEKSIAGVAAVSFASDADYTMTALNGADDEARCMILSVTSVGSLTATRNLICPTQGKLYFVKNGTTGGRAITVKTAAGTGITIPNGSTMVVFCDGTNVVTAHDTVIDANFTIADDSDTTKKVQFQLSGLTTATTRTLTVPDASTTLVGTDNTQTLTGKTLTSPVINTATITGSTMTQVPISQSSKSANYTTVLADGGTHILHPSADNNARTFTIDSNATVAYPTGTVLTFVNEINTVTISITSDTMTLMGSGATGSRTLAANGIATALKIASTKWVIAGTGLT